MLDLPYFEQHEPVVWDEGGTYVQTEIVFTQNITHEWNHGLGEIVTALLEHGMQTDACSRSTTRSRGRRSRAR